MAVTAGLLLLLLLIATCDDDAAGGGMRQPLFGTGNIHISKKPLYSATYVRGFNPFLEVLDALPVLLW